MSFFDTWIGQVTGAAGVVLTLSALVKLGQELGKRDRQRDYEKEIDSISTLLSANRERLNSNERELQRAQLRIAELVAQSGGTSQQSVLEKLRDFADNPNSGWYSPPATPYYPRPVVHGGRPVLTVCNLKGGVGKTTIAVHLAVAFARMGKRVLFVDLDFQGSGSTLLVRSAGRGEHLKGAGLSRAQHFLEGRLSESELIDLVLPLGGEFENLGVITAHHVLAEIEQSILIRWILGDLKQDPRYVLSRVLQSPDFPHDLIVIDAPPRLSMGMVQALVASTHVLVPTQLNRIATEACVYFANVLKEMARKGVNQSVDFCGIVANMVAQQAGYSTQEELEINYLNESIGPLFPGADPVWQDVPIHDKVAFARPRLVYQPPANGGVNQAAAEMDALARKVARRLGFATA